MYGTIGRAQRLQELVEREWGAARGGGQPVPDTRVALVRGAPAGAAPRVAHEAAAADVRGGRGRDILTNLRLPAALHKALRQKRSQQDVNNRTVMVGTTAEWSQ